MRRLAITVLLAACGFKQGALSSSTIDGGDDSDIDSALDIDAATSPDDVIAPITCPSTYTVAINGSTTKYRLITTPAEFTAVYSLCNADQPDRTHLASLETVAEVNGLVSALAVAGFGSQYYIGAVQQPNQATTTAGWFVFTGAALPAGLFGSSNDDNPGEDNEENLAALNTGDLLHDVTGDLPYPAVCECDGLPIDATVASYIP